MQKKKIVYPYIPNSAPDTKKTMMNEIGAKDVWDLYEEIPETLRYLNDLLLPKPILDEYGIKQHVQKILAKNKNCEEYLNFLGAGCARHFVPAVVDEITTRGEFLTCYGAESWADHGKYQTFFEYNSMLCDLLATEVTSVPQYDGGQAIATAISMANRINGRKKVLVPKLMNFMHRSILNHYMDSVQKDLKIDIIEMEHDQRSGKINLHDLALKLKDDVCAVFIENPSFLGILEVNIKKIAEMAKEVGAEMIVYTSPISLGVLESPANLGATIVCGDLHALGLHLNAGGGQAGFISTSSENKYLQEYKDFMYGLVEPKVKGEYVFGNLLIERTHYAKRAKGKEYTGTGTNLWMISAAVYMALLGPSGFKEIGESIFQKSQYAAKQMQTLPKVQIRFDADFFMEFVVDFSNTGLSVKDINQQLLHQNIFGGLDLSPIYPSLHGCALYCVTEIISKEEIDRLCEALRSIIEKRGSCNG